MPQASIFDVFKLPNANLRKSLNHPQACRAPITCPKIIHFFNTTKFFLIFVIKSIKWFSWIYKMRYTKSFIFFLFWTTCHFYSFFLKIFFFVAYKFEKKLKEYHQGGSFLRSKYELNMYEWVCLVEAHKRNDLMDILLKFCD